MAPKSKNISIKMTPGKLTQLTRAVANIRAHYGPVLAIWRELPEAQRQELLVHSPLLAELLAGVV